jgi:hypothetical protein
MGLLKSAVDGLSDSDLWRRPTPHNKPVLGHIV